MKGKYETLLADHEEMQDKYEKELERILEENHTQQIQLKQQLMKCDVELKDCREKLLEPKSETIVEAGYSTPIKIKNLNVDRLYIQKTVMKTGKPNILNWKNNYLNQ
ncbi:hypothetical protein TNCV_1922971 [Trichonephila clavipes]|nr:hypothetical protein TNCV_1922971 [Trichonephila clavipes]